MLTSPKRLESPRRTTTPSPRRLRNIMVDAKNKDDRKIRKSRREADEQESSRRQRNSKSRERVDPNIAKGEELKVVVGFKRGRSPARSKCKDDKDIGKDSTTRSARSSHTHTTRSSSASLSSRGGPPSQAPSSPCSSILSSTRGLSHGSLRKKARETLHRHNLNNNYSDLSEESRGSDADSTTKTSKKHKRRNSTGAMESIKEQKRDKLKQQRQRNGDSSKRTNSTESQEQPSCLLSPTKTKKKKRSKSLSHGTEEHKSSSRTPRTTVDDQGKVRRVSEKTVNGDSDGDDAAAASRASSKRSKSIQRTPKSTKSNKSVSSKIPTSSKVSGTGSPRSGKKKKATSSTAAAAMTPKKKGDKKPAPAKVLSVLPAPPLTTEEKGRPPNCVVWPSLTSRPPQESQISFRNDDRNPDITTALDARNTVLNAGEASGLLLSPLTPSLKRRPVISPLPRSTRPPSFSSQISDKSMWVQNDLVVDLRPVKEGERQKLIDVLQDELMFAKKEKVTVLGDAIKTKRELRDVRLELQKSQTERRELRSTVLGHSKLLKEREAKIVNLEKVVETQLDKVEGLEDEVVRANNEIFDLEMRLSQAGLLDGCAAMESGLQQRIEERLERKERELEMREKELRKDHRRILLGDGQPSQNRDQIELEQANKRLEVALNNVKEDAKSILLAKEDEIQELRIQVDGLSVSSGKENKKLQLQLKSEHSRATCEMQRMKDTIAILKLEIQRLKKELASQDRGDATALQNKLDSCKAQYKVMESKFEGAQRRNVILEDDIEHWKQLNCSLEDEVAEWKTEAASWKVKAERASRPAEDNDILSMSSEHRPSALLSMTRKWAESITSMNTSTHSTRSGMSNREETISRATFHH